MELRDLRSYVAVAEEGHFGRASERLQMSSSRLSELIRDLERELGTPLFSRTTRKVEITVAGQELLGRARRILDDVAAAGAAVRSIGAGHSGKVLLGVTPPALVGLVPSLIEQFTGQFPDAQVEARPMWRPNLIQGLHTEEIDIAIVLGSGGKEDGLTGRSLAAQPLVAGVRPGHPLAALNAVKLTDLASEVLGIASDDLFPAWARYQRQALSAAGVAPPTVTLSGPDLEAARWADDHPRVDWILLLPSLAAAHDCTVTVPVQPRFLVPFALLWRDDGTAAPIAGRFITTALAADLPAGWSRADD